MYLAAIRATWRPDNLNERLATTQVITRLAQRAGSKEIEFLGEHYRSVTLLEAIRVDEADEAWRAARQLADELGLPAFRWQVASAT